MAARSSAVMLRLGEAQFSARDKERIQTALNKNGTLESMWMPTSSWGEAEVDALCNLLQTNRILTSLWLQTAEFTPRELINLCSVLSTNTRLMWLNLPEIRWTSETVALLCDLIKDNRLTILRLDSASFSPENFKCVCEAIMENGLLSKISLAKTTWNDESVRAFCQYLRQNRSLRSLRLKNSEMNPRTLLDLLRSLQSNNTLEVLTLTMSKFSNKGMDHILQGLCKNNSLRYISLHGSQLTDAAAPALRAFLEKSHMKTLGFSSAKFSDSGVSDMLCSLCQHSALEELVFNCSNLSDRVIAPLCRMLQDNHQIKKILFKKSKLTDAGVVALLECLRTNKTLQSIDLDNDLTDESIADLCSFITQATSLQSLWGTHMTDSTLAWCLEEVRELEKVTDVRFDGKLMTIDITLAEQTDTIRIAAESESDTEGKSEAQIQGAIAPGPRLSETEQIRMSELSMSTDDQHKLPEERIEETKAKKVKKPWYKALASRLRLGKAKELHPQTVPDELYLLDQKYLQAYREACTRGTQTVYQCRVMLLGYEGAGKTSIKNSLLGQPFESQHVITNGIEIEVNKCRNWEPLTDDSEYAELVAKHIMNVVKLQEGSNTPEEQMPRGPTPSTSRMTVQSPELPDPVGEVTGSKRQDDHMLETHDHVEMDALNREALPTASSAHSIPQPKRVKQPTIPADVAEFLRREFRNKKQDETKAVGSELFFWDSGGQGIFYNSTKTFLSRRCVFLLAVSMLKNLYDSVPTMRKDWCGQDVVDTGCPQTVGDHIHYWLSCVHTFVPEKDEKQTSSPSVIIVITHKDGCTREQEQAFYRDIWEFIKDKPYGNDVQMICSISNVHRDEKDLLTLRHTITELAKQQAYLLPLTWFAFKDELLKTSNNPVPRITLEEATELGLHCGMRETTDIQAAIQFFHEVGNILYFNEPTLRDFIITKPQWLVSHFREVLTVPSIHNQRVFPNSRRHFRRLDEEGVLHEDVLRHVWPEEVQEELIALMQKYAILLPMPAGYKLLTPEDEDGATRYLVPCLLPLSDPEVEKEATSTDIPALILLPPGGFIPVGLTSRLFAALVNEDGWRVGDQIYGQSATFLPKGNDSSVQVTIMQRQAVIELWGKKLMGAGSNVNLYDCLSVILSRLEAITLSLCPLRNFTIAMYCPCCKRRGRENVVCLGYRGKECKEFMYCSRHQDKCSTSEMDIWLKDVCYADPELDMLSQAAESMRKELELDLPRLIGPTGLGVRAASVLFLAHIRSLSIIQEHDIQNIEAEPIPFRKANVLVKYLLMCSKANLVLFAWLLVEVNQAHQLPQSIPACLKSLLADKSKNDIMKVAKRMSREHKQQKVIDSLHPSTHVEPDTMAFSDRKSQ